MEFEDLPGWTFGLDEISAGVYKAVGRHRMGPCVEITGADPEELIERCRVSALETSEAIRRKLDR